MMPVTRIPAPRVVLALVVLIVVVLVVAQPPGLFSPGGGDPTPDRGTVVDVRLSQRVNVSTVDPGDRVTYSLRVVNEDLANATTAEVTADLPACVTVESTIGPGTDDGTRWTVELPAGRDATLAIVATVDCSPGPVTATAVAAVTGDATDPDRRNNVADATVSVTDAAGAGDGGARPRVESAVEHSGGTVEVALDTSLSDSDAVEPGDVSVTKTNCTGVHDLTDRAALGLDGTGGVVTIRLPGDVRPTATLVLGIDGVERAIDVTPTGATVTVPASGTGTVSRRRVYAGTQVAVVTPGLDDAIDVLKEGDRLTTRATGPNSRVFVYDSTRAEVGDTYSFDVHAGGHTDVVISDLGLSVSAPSEVTAGETVAVSATANSVGRVVRFGLLDGDGNLVDAACANLGPDGQASATLDVTDSAAAGDYTVVATDADSGVSAVFDAITVREST